MVPRSMPSTVRLCNAPSGVTPVSNRIVSRFPWSMMVINKETPRFAPYLEAEVDVLSGSQEQIDRQQSTNDACQDREHDSEASRRMKLLFVDGTANLQEVDKCHDHDHYT